MKGRLAMLKTIKPQDATAGCKKMLATEGVSFIGRALGEIDDPIEFAFMQGYLAGLNFPTVPKSADVYGFGVVDYACNALINVKKELVSQAIGSGSLNVTIIELGRKDDSKEESKPAEGDAE